MNLKMLLLAAALVLAIAAPAQAGKDSSGANCVKNADGSGWCAGTASGFRALPDPNAYVAFYDWGTTDYAAFYASFNGDSFACRSSKTANPALGTLWPRAGLGYTYFYIVWDASGICNTLVLGQGSLYQ